MTERAPFYNPWTGDAQAYPVAATIADGMHGLRRRRKPVTFLLRLGSPDYALPCASCGERLADPPRDPSLHTDNLARHGGDAGEHAYVDFRPRRRLAIPQHYTCAWGSTLAAVLRLGRVVYG